MRSAASTPKSRSSRRATSTDARTRQRLEAERRRSLVFRRLEWIVSEVRERLRFDEPREEIAGALS